MPTNQPTKAETHLNVSRRLTTSISLDRTLWERLHTLAEAKRAALGGPRSVSGVITEILTAHLAGTQ